MSIFYPLTPVQEGMFAGSFSKGRPWLCLEQVVCHFDDVRLDLDRLAQAWTGIAACFPPLRSTINRAEAREPVQRMQPPALVETSLNDWQNFAPDTLDRDFDAFIVDDRTRDIDPTDFPALRLALFHTGADQRRLV